MTGQEETIAWIMANWVVTKPISKEQIVSHDGWEICVVGESYGEMWLHCYPDGTMFLRAINPGGKGFAHLTNGDGWSSREPWNIKAIESSLDAVLKRRKTSKEDSKFEQLSLL